MLFRFFGYFADENIYDRHEATMNHVFLTLQHISIDSIDSTNITVGLSRHVAKVSPTNLYYIYSRIFI